VDDPTAGASSIIRIDGRPAISFSGELETENTLGVTNAAKQAVADLTTLPAGVEVTEGFDSQQQTEGFRDMVTAIGYSIILVYLVMALSFRSLIHPFTILFSLPFALVGAALALFITSSVLGISSMIGMMMLVGVVVTNAIVLLELVQQLRNRGKNAHDALIEGGRTRLRPIWMTALTAILALIPLALSQEAGAIIAGELARAVIGGLLVSTLLTLIVVPVVYSLLDPVNNFFRQRFSRNSADAG
jgi:HAE1 family hydrophobic/amphiphilic exporter-1